MTAVNIFLQPSRGIVMTDALFLDAATGAPVGYSEKCVPVPGQRTVIAARGDPRVPNGVACDVAILYEGIDSLIADEGQGVRDSYETFLRSGLQVAVADVEIMVVGWSDIEDRPRGCYLTFVAGVWTFACVNPEIGLATPDIDDRELDRLEAIGAGPDVHYDLASFDPIRHGLPFMEAQRRSRMPLPSAGGKLVHFVGGHVLLTEVTRESVTQTVIHEWPDAWGEPVQPAPFAATARDSAALDAAAAKRARKAAKLQRIVS